ncbi:hypothetical protein AGMMS49950_01240 [Endomicrobiia bacterium]|nr:hypothetical protein AGMMS49531_00270 [Endomicrobiia bacterium]GHT69129.1 hypothetical protein AGMMS49950_01240 [Endomicrobiia bacterium]
MVADEKVAKKCIGQRFLGWLLHVAHIFSRLSLFYLADVSKYCASYKTAKVFSRKFKVAKSTTLKLKEGL